MVDTDDSVSDTTSTVLDLLTCQTLVNYYMLKIEPYCKMSKTATGTHNYDVVSGFCVCFTQTGVHCHTGTQERGSCCGVETIWNWSDVIGGPENVLLESTRCIIS